MNKSDIRKIFLDKRRDMTPDEVLWKSTVIQNKIYNFDWYKNSNSVMIYVSFQNEVDTHSIIQNALYSGKKVIVPVCAEKNTIIPAQISTLGDLRANKFGILEPENITEYQGEIDAIIVPGVAFDRNLSRVGFGCGYYDRFLIKYPESIKAGICFQNQLSDIINVDVNDIPMDIIITEEEIIKNND